MTYDNVLMMSRSHIQGEIHVMDSTHLSTTSCAARHGYSPIIGVDVLRPGTSHCVVREVGEWLLY